MVSKEQPLPTNLVVVNVTMLTCQMVSMSIENILKIFFSQQEEIKIDINIYFFLHFFKSLIVKFHLRKKTSLSIQTKRKRKKTE